MVALEEDLAVRKMTATLSIDAVPHNTTPAPATGTFFFGATAAGASKRAASAGPANLAGGLVDPIRLVDRTRQRGGTWRPPSESTAPADPPVRVQLSAAALAPGAAAAPGSASVPAAVAVPKITLSSRRSVPLRTVEVIPATAVLESVHVATCTRSLVPPAAMLIIVVALASVAMMTLPGFQRPRSWRSRPPRLRRPSAGGGIHVRVRQRGVFVSFRLWALLVLLSGGGHLCCVEAEPMVKPMVELNEEAKFKLATLRK